MKQKAYVLAFMLCLSLSACNFGNTSDDYAQKDMGGGEEQEEKIKELETPPQSSTNNTIMETLTKEEQLAPPKVGEEIAIIETNKGTMKLKFFKDHAPNLSKNFIELSNRDYYDNLIFHRVIKGFMIQGGDPKGNGTGGESYTGEGLADEPGALNLQHFPGAVACAKSSLPNSIGSQFYIVHEPAHFLDKNYSVFGQVFEGLEVVDTIANVETQPGDKPVEDVIIENVTITTFEG